MHTEIENNKAQQMIMRGYIRAIRETRAMKREWVVVISKGGDLHVVVKSLHVPYCDRKRVICTVAAFLAHGGEYAATLTDEEAADALAEYIETLDAELESLSQGLPLTHHEETDTRTN